MAGYEQTGSAVTKHCSFNGVPVAVRDGSGMFLLYQDGVSSNVYVTNAWGSIVGSRGYLAFGGLRFCNGALPTDRRCTASPIRIVAPRRNRRRFPFSVPPNL